ncbi:phospholipase D-like domain-containing protein [Blastococcus sp. SYSU DS0552]
MRLISQPFPDGHDLSQMLDRLSDDDGLTELVVVVAWAKRSGFRQVERALGRLRERGVRITIIVGISEGGATRQGLHRALEVADAAFVYHVAGRTFHPKLYVGSGPESFTALVGSHNLTRGGAVENFELGVVVEGRTGNPDDAEFLAQIQAFIDRLLDDSEVCLRLDEETIDRIIARYPVGDEDERTGRRDTPRSIDDSDDEGKGPMFGRSRHVLRRGLPVSDPTAPGSRPDRVGAGRPRSERPEEPGQDPGGGTASDSPIVERRWIKLLRASDAQRLGGNSNPTGHLTLVRAGNPLDDAVGWFRDEFFGDEDWQPVSPGSAREQLQAPFEVIIDGVSHGTRGLVVDYNPSFQADQNNRVVTLRWGNELNDYLHRQADRRGDWVSLERFSDGTYRLTIAAAPTGESTP